MKDNVIPEIQFAVDRLRYIRESVRKESLAEVSGRIGVSRSFISNIENLHSEPKLSTLMMICNDYGIGVEELFSGFSRS